MPDEEFPKRTRAPRRDLIERAAVRELLRPHRERLAALQEPVARIRTLEFARGIGTNLPSLDLPEVDRLLAELTQAEQLFCDATEGVQNSHVRDLARAFRACREIVERWRA
jgi:hypothetical protein